MVTIDLTKFNRSQEQLGAARQLLAECQRDSNMTHVSQPFTGETIESHLAAVATANDRVQQALYLRLPELIKLAQLDYEVIVDRAENFAKWHLAKVTEATHPPAPDA